MPSTEYRIRVGLAALVAAGYPPDMLPDGPYRIVAKYEPEPGGANAMGYYLEHFTIGDGWAENPPWCDTHDEAMGEIRALERAAQATDRAGLRAWMSEWDVIMD